ncbi:clathrin-coated vesicle protein [Lentinula aciculospora]|uniref:Clathrin-coated vesicle protein n=1 Tax=Lentinula aciculospora TaxID=153920 RepID=A0A9W9A3V0_9AGAR|nr:clathrin-coated vesicle protein [Lentinula aciculospora]
MDVEVFYPSLRSFYITSVVKELHFRFVDLISLNKRALFTKPSLLSSASKFEVDMSSEPDDIEAFQEEELLGDNGMMYIFQWLSLTENKLATITVDQLKAQQADLEASLVKIIIAAAPYPPPGRATRNGVARCLITIYSRGETRRLFDTLQTFMKVASEFKTVDRDIYRTAALSCVGDLMAVYGTQYMSFMSEITVVALKSSKSSSTPLLRCHALLALKKSLDAAKRAVTDSAFKDILKQMKTFLNDKCLPVERAAANVLISLYSGVDDGRILTTGDVDSILGLAVKSLEGADQVTRQSMSRLVGHILASTQIERAVPIPEVAHKNKKDADTNDERASSPIQAAAEVTKPMLTPTEMLNHLSSHFNKPNATRKLRIGLFDCYVALLNNLGTSFVENNYALIVSHLLTEIVSNPRNNTTRYEVLLTRTLVGIILRDLIGVRMLSEQGQIGAIRELSTAYIKRWPAMMPGQTSPASSVLVVVLREVAGLLQQLGNAPPPVQDALAEPLITLLAHPSHTTRVTASWALRCFCYSTPLRLPKTVITIIEMLQRDLTSILSPASLSDINSRTLGHAYGLAALVSIIRERPLYVSYDVSAKVLDMSIQLLKRAGEHDVKVASVEVEVSWVLIASLMSLGPNFVRPHLPQLLVLWRNALPKPTTKDSANNAGRMLSEWMFLLQVRESALGAIHCFLQHNATLVNLDVGRRIASVLGNALSFANNFITLNIEEPVEPPLSSTYKKGLPVKGREALLRRRVYQCFSILGFSGITESTQSTLLQSVVSLFASPEGYAGSSVQAAIASSSGSFTSVWQGVDGYAYGVTFTEVADDSVVANDVAVNGGDKLNRDTVELAIDNLLRKPVLAGCEHDPLSLCQIDVSKTEYRMVEPPPPATAVVDSAINLFADLLPLQDLTSIIRTTTQLLDSVRSPKLDKNIGRKAAVLVNAAIALVLTLRLATTAHYRASRDTFGSSQVTNLLSSFLKETLVDGDRVLRSAGSESIGRLASLAGTNFLTSQMKTLYEEVVNNRDPYARSGCALAFGAVYDHVGGLAAGAVLKTTVGVLMSLSNDPHPVVHFFALNALARVINAASLAYSPYVSKTLGMLLQVYSSESHEIEGGTLSNANLSGDYPAYPVVCQIIDAVITVLGPDIQDSQKTRALLLNLVHGFFLEDDQGVLVEAIKCQQHFLMFAPEHVNIPNLVDSFRGHLSSSRRPLKVASINAFYQLVQKDALVMSKLGGDRLVEDLFGMLDDDSSVDGVRNVITSWLEQTVVYNPSAWIDLCQRIMSRTTASQQVSDAANSRDDEGESLNLGNQEGGRSRQTSRWRTQLFALQCLHHICTVVSKSGRREHLDIIFARSRDIPISSLLITRVPDLIKMAFTASTAYVTEIRLEGLVVLRDVIQIFARSPDPAFEDALLLEQHQAPITAALTPAFSADSTPEILASAVHACAVFVGCGVVKDVTRMGRILKLLNVALDQSKDSAMVSLGETGELSPNGSAMLRISTLSAWAQLEVASYQQAYLLDVVKPYRAILATMWIAALRDYASIRVDSESLHDTSSAALDSTYSSLGKEVLLPYYIDSWSIILQAVASSMQAKDPYIAAAMDGREQETTVAIDNSKSTREEPTTFFYIVFGLVYEALAEASTDSLTNSAARQASVVASLQTLKFLVRPEYAGKAMLDPIIFDEFISVCYRLAMTESAPIQIHLLEVMTVFAATQGSRTSENMSFSSPQSHCLRICAHILRHSTSHSSGPIIQGDVVDRVKMLLAAFSAFATIAAGVSTTFREDVRSVGILLYSEILKDESNEIDLAGPTFPSLKVLLDLPLASSPDARDRYQRMIHGLLSACLLNIDEMRGRQGVACTKKVKNNLLAAVLILTAIPPSIKIGQPVVEHCCFLISQKLLETHEVSLTAAHCARILIAASASRNVLLRCCVKLLMPALIEYIAKMVPLVNDGSIPESHATAISEVWKAFAIFFGSLAESARTRLLGVLLPTISLLLADSQNSPSPVVAQSIKHLLSYATISPTAFKKAAAKLDAPTRELLEYSVRRAVGGGPQTVSVQNAMKPQISLLDIIPENLDRDDTHTFGSHTELQWSIAFIQEFKLKLSSFRPYSVDPAGRNPS